MEDRDPVLLLNAAELRRKVASFAQAKAEIRNFNRQMLIEDVDVRGLKGRREWEAITRLTGRSEAGGYANSSTRGLISDCWQCGRSG